MMRKRWIGIGKALLGAVLLLHIAAVGVYTVPRSAQDPFSQWTRGVLLPSVTPYLLATMQWQLWDLFAPDPLRAVSTYRIDLLTADGWTTIRTLEPGTFSIVRHAPWFKLLLRAVDEAWQPQDIVRRLTLLPCTEQQLRAGTPLRLVRLRSVLPVPHYTSGGIDWGTLPTPQEEAVLHASCPSS